MVIANFLLLPFAAHLHEHTEQELLLQELVIEGVLAIRAQVKPSVVERLLRSFVTPSERPDAQLSRRYLRSHRDGMREPEPPGIELDSSRESLRPQSRPDSESAQSLSV